MTATSTTRLSGVMLELVKFGAPEDGDSRMVCTMRIDPSVLHIRPEANDFSKITLESMIGKTDGIVAIRPVLPRTNDLTYEVTIDPEVNVFGGLHGVSTRLRETVARFCGFEI